VTRISEQTRRAEDGRLGVLVVDDDSLLLNLLHTVLKRAGFSVWVAPSGAAAIELYRRHQSAIGVVLLDVRMPELDGPQTLAELSRLNPRVLCCFMSGYTGQYTREDLLALGAVHLLQKPFRMEDAIALLTRLLQGDVGTSVSA
jgi:CheY-like chemotaxis protein